MRGNLRGAPLPPLFQTYMGEGAGQRGRQHREDEVSRLARWSRVAPPFGVGGTSGSPEKETLVDSAILQETHRFSLCDDACVISHHLENVTVTQGAPARVTRNGLVLPTVTPATPAGELPYVIATRFPSGPYSITTLGRMLPSGWVEPRANVSLTLPTTQGVNGTTLGVFGHYGQLAVIFPEEKECSPLGGLRRPQNVPYQVGPVTALA